MKMLAIVIISVLVQHLVTNAVAQKTVDDNICEMYREDIDQLSDYREASAAVASSVKDANDPLHGKDNCIKEDQFQDNCTLSETHKVCFQRDQLIPFGKESPSEFNDLDQFSPNDIEKVFVTGINMYTRTWGSHVIIGAIEVTYNASSRTFQHGTQCKDHQANKTERFRLDPGDRITSISAKTGMMIDQQ